MSRMSRESGKRGERYAVDYLRGLGFEAHRGQQHSGSDESPDVVLDHHPELYVEVKYGSVELGQASLDSAMEQAISECGDREPVILWRPKGKRQWRLTFQAKDPPVLVTTTGDLRIKSALQSLAK